MTLFVAWASAAASLDDLIDQVEKLRAAGCYESRVYEARVARHEARVTSCKLQVEALRADPAAPPDHWDEAGCPFAPLVLRMVAREPSARPTAAEVVRAVLEAA